MTSMERHMIQTRNVIGVEEKEFAEENSSDEFHSQADPGLNQSILMQLFDVYILTLTLCVFYIVGCFSRGVSAQCDPLVLSENASCTSSASALDPPETSVFAAPVDNRPNSVEQGNDDSAKEAAYVMEPSSIEVSSHAQCLPQAASQCETIKLIHPDCEFPEDWDIDEWTIEALTRHDREIAALVISRHWRTGGPNEQGMRYRVKRLPDEALERMRSKDCSTLEQEVFQFYNMFAAHCELIGILAPDIDGPDSFSAAFGELRVRIETAHREAVRRIDLTKRLAVDMPMGRGLNLLVEAQDQLATVKQAVAVHSTIGTLLKSGHRRCRREFEQADEARSFLHILEDEKESVQVVQTETEESIHPSIGVLEPLPHDAMPPLVRSNLACAENNAVRGKKHDIEYTYESLYEKCSQGEACVVDCWWFTRDVIAERAFLKRTLASRERFWRAQAYNRVLRSWKGSYAALETDSHYTAITHRKAFLRRTGKFEIPGAQESLDRLVAVCKAQQLSKELPERSSSDPMTVIATAETDVDSDAVSGGAAREPALPDFTNLTYVVEQGSADDLEIDVCVSCLERPATQVGKGCGHLVYCKSCHRKAVWRAAGGEQSDQVLGRGGKDVNKKALERTKLTCPLCRHVSVLVSRDRYTGTVFK